MTKRVVLLHGALGTRHHLQGFEKNLSEAGFQVSSFNFSGHGGEPFAKGFGIDIFAEELHRHLNMSPTPAHIFGYSMGGYVALSLAVGYPELIDHIAVLGTKFDWTEESSRREIRKLDPEKISAKVPGFASALEKIHQPNDWKELMKKTADMMLKLGKQPILTEQNLRMIENKTLVMLGDTDDMVDREFSVRVASLLPKGKFLLLPDTAHAIEKVDSSRVSTILVDFFDI
jgi:pimeloyl-ACP methyl ester carboxylesterase